MNKKEFLKKLSKRLEILEDKEIEDIISEYEGYIDEKVNRGLSEEEAVKELGNFDEIVNDLLAAYKVKNKDEKENSFERVIENIGEALDKFISTLGEKNGKDILKILIEIIIILFLIWLLKIPFSMIRELGSNIFIDLGTPIGNIFRALWSFIIELSYIIISIIFFVKTLEQRYFKNVSEEIISTTNEEIKNSKKENKPKEEKIKTETIKKEKRDTGFISALSNLCIIILKIIVIMILVGVIFYTLGITIALGFMIYLIIKGVAYFGILILLISMLLGGIFFLELGINFIFNKPNKAFIIFSKLLTIIVLTGIGLTVSAIEIANTEIIYDENYPNIKSITKEIPMEDNLTFYYYDKIIIDNTLKDKIKIEYKYPNFEEIEVLIELDPCRNGYCLDHQVSHFVWNKKFLDHIINNLKDKKIYSYELDIEKIIYVSEKNFNKITENNDIENDSEITTKDLEVININKSDANYNFITIKEMNEDVIDDEEIKTIKLSKALSNNIKPNLTYTFTFKIEDFTNDLEQLLEEGEIINISLKK